MIDTLLEGIHTELDAILPQRKCAGELKEKLRAVKELYRAILAPAEIEGARLESEKQRLWRILEGKKEVKPVIVAVESPVYHPPPQTIVPDEPVAPAPPPKDPRLERKQELADATADIGDILELMDWGEEGAVWKLRSPFESVEEQARRLELWLGALQSRRSYWQAQVSALEEEAQYPLWQALLALDPAGRQADLEARRSQQEAANRRLESEIDRYEDLLRRQPSRGVEP